jgi:hypothetical protein
MTRPLKIEAKVENKILDISDNAEELLLSVDPIEQQLGLLGNNILYMYSFIQVATDDEFRSVFSIMEDAFSKRKEETH